MREAGMAEEAKYDHVLTSEYAALIAQEYGRNPIVNDEAAFDIYPPPPHPEPHTLPTRPPVVTIMGHVDHGKTTLLDTLRSSSVAKGEAGGITQHIGAFSVPVPHAMRNSESGPKTITFLDTPGHAAFSAMRARGAQVTDIVVLVVAADDGIMPQTREVLDLVKRDSNVNLVVAINKCDKPEADVDRVQKQLMEVGIQLESMGGDIPSVEVSGLTGKGLPDLVDTLSAIAEVKDIRAEDDGPVQGYVLESRMQKGLGATATVLVLRGCLKPGALVICGTHQAKVRVMQDDAGKPVKSAGPGSAVVVTGWKSLPSAGEEVLQATSESEIKRAIANRERQADIESALADVEVINAARRAERERRAAEADLDDDAVRALERERAREEDGQKSLRLIIKADVSGSAEAVAGALVGIGNDKAATKIIASEVGEVSESDVTRAKISGAAVVAFNVKTPRPIQMLADREGVPIISSPIIYRLMEDVRSRVIDLLPKIIETRVIGEANVVQLFDISMKGKVTKKIAGCRVSNGVLQRDKLLRVIRNGTTVYEEGSLDTMRHHKSDVMEVRKGIECGLNISGYDDLREGDMIQMFERVEKPGIL
ncbi:P-loop containing nucleoside triphosphate hydrolase protein [Schizophyllum commune]